MTRSPSTAGAEPTSASASAKTRTSRIYVRLASLLAGLRLANCWRVLVVVDGRDCLGPSELLRAHAMTSFDSAISQTGQERQSICTHRKDTIRESLADLLSLAVVGRLYLWVASATERDRTHEQDLWQDYRMGRNDPMTRYGHCAKSTPRLQYR